MQNVACCTHSSSFVQPKITKSQPLSLHKHQNPITPKTSQYLIKSSHSFTFHASYSSTHISPGFRSRSESHRVGKFQHRSKSQNKKKKNSHLSQIPLQTKTSKNANPLKHRLPHLFLAWLAHCRSENLLQSNHHLHLLSKKKRFSPFFESPLSPSQRQRPLKPPEAPAGLCPRNPHDRA